MDEGYQIIGMDKPDDAAWEAIGGGISAYNKQQAGPEGGVPVCFVLRAPDGEVAGGLIGDTYWGWLYINLLWVKEDLRGQGYGRQLLALAEEEARHRGAAHAYLDTFSFQAPGFYEKQGYKVFGELPDFPHGHTRYFLTKALG